MPRLDPFRAFGVFRGGFLIRGAEPGSENAGKKKARPLGRA
jgi:hypothetical protein